MTRDAMLVNLQSVRIVTREVRSIHSPVVDIVDQLNRPRRINDR